MSTREESKNTSRQATKRHIKRHELIKIPAYCIVVVLLLLFAVISANSIKCYTCLFHLARCTNPLDCYNQPDTCSNTNFSPLNSQVVDCEFGCEQYVVTDPTGSVIAWQRGCANERSPKSSYICFSRIIYAPSAYIPLRHEQCWCHSDYCNSSIGLRINNNLLIVVTLIVTFLLAKY